jgi:hypothetical protein
MKQRLWGRGEEPPKSMASAADTEQAPEPAAESLFRGGRNMALKIPSHQFEATLAFYRDTLGLPIETMPGGTPVVQFGAMRLWLDRSDTVSQAELWLELTTEKADEAAKALEAAAVTRCDQIEPLPKGFRGFWVMSPVNIVHLVAEPGQDGGN